MRPYFPIGPVVIIALLLAFVAYPAFAQDAAPVIAYNSVWFDLWSVVQPVVVILVSTVGPVLATWISARLISLLKVSDDAKKAEVQALLREALHQPEANALKFALAKDNIGPSAPQSSPKPSSTSRIRTLRRSPNSGSNPTPCAASS